MWSLYFNDERQQQADEGAFKQDFTAQMSLRT